MTREEISKDQVPLSRLVSEDTIADLLSQSPVALAIYRGPKFVIELANHTMLSFWNKMLEETINRPLFEALPEARGQGFEEIMRKVYEEGTSFKAHEVPVKVKRDGALQLVYFNISYEPLRDKSGKINGIIGTAHDVNEQVLLRKTVEESEKKYRQLVEQADVATAIYEGENMVIRMANDAMLAVWGKDRSVVGMKLEEALPELQGQPFLGLLGEVFRTGITYKATEDKVDLIVDGKLQTYYYNFSYKALRNDEGQITSILNMAVNVTSLVNARKELQEAEEKVNLALEASHLGVWRLDPVSGQVELDERCRELLGFSAYEEIAYEDVLSRIYEEDRPLVTKAVEASLNPQDAVPYDIEYRALVNDQLVWTRNKGKAYFNDKGELSDFSGTIQDITVEKRKDDLLRQIEGRFRKAFDDAFVGIAISDLQGVYLFVNKAFQRITGYSSEELLNKDYVLTTHPDDVHKSQAYTSFEWKESSYVTLSKRYIRPDGTIVWTNVHSTLLHDESGRPDVWFSIIHDVTQEKTLRDEQRKLLTLVDNSVDLMAVASLEGKNTYVNKAAMELLGFESYEQAMDMHLRELHTVKDFDFVKERILPQVMEEGRWAGRVNLKKLKTGEIIPVYQHCLRIDDPENNQPIGIGTVMRDLRPELAAQRSLIENELRFRQYVEGLPVAFYTVDKEGRITLFNQACVTLWGRTPELGKEYWCGAKQLYKLNGDPVPYGSCSTSAAIRERRAFQTEAYVERPGGELRRVVAYPQPLFDSEGELLGAMNIVVDITDLKRTQEALRESQNKTFELAKNNIDLRRSNKDLEQFAYIASHDLQEPLRKIRTFGDLMMENRHNDEAAQKYFDKLNNSAQRMSDLIRDVLQYSRVSSNVEVFQEVDLSTVFKNITGDLEILMEEKKALITCEDLPVVRASESQMNQLFYNLVGNALKFSNKQPVIAVTCRKVKDLDFLPSGKDYWKIAVADNGIGFEPEYAEKIFTIFQRLSHTREYAGTGIGLALCKKIIENHEGHIHAVGKPGEGATFVFYLPCWD